MRTFLFLLGALVIAAGVPALALTLASDSPDHSLTDVSSARADTPGSVLFRGGFDAGAIAPWQSTQEAAKDRVEVVDSPTDSSENAARFEVRPGDEVASGNRAEVIKTFPGDKENDERWYAWSTMFPKDGYPAYSDWQIFFQLARSGEPPPIAMGVNGNTMGLFFNRNINDLFNYLWRTPLERGVWHRFVLHVKLSPNAANGFVELWYDGKKVLAPKAVATMRRTRGTTGSPVPNALKTGLYRSKTTKVKQVVYQDSMRVGTSFSAVAGP